MLPRQCFGYGAGFNGGGAAYSRVPWVLIMCPRLRDCRFPCSHVATTWLIMILFHLQGLVEAMSLEGRELVQFGVIFQQHVQIGSRNCSCILALAFWLLRFGSRNPCLLLLYCSRWIWQLGQGPRNLLGHLMVMMSAAFAICQQQIMQIVLSYYIATAPVEVINCTACSKYIPRSSLKITLVSVSYY